MAQKGPRAFTSQGKSKLYLSPRSVAARFRHNAERVPCFDTSRIQLLDPKAVLVHTCTLSVRDSEYCWSSAVNIHITVGRLSSRLHLISVCATLEKKKLQTAKFIHIFIVSDVLNSFTSANITHMPWLQKYISVNITIAVQFILYQFPSPLCFVKDAELFLLYIRPRWLVRHVNIPQWSGSVTEQRTCACFMALFWSSLWYNICLRFLELVSVGQSGAAYSLLGICTMLQLITSSFTVAPSAALCPEREISRRKAIRLWSHVLKTDFNQRLTRSKKLNNYLVSRFSQGGGCLWA